MPSFSSGYKTEYIALVNEVEAKIKKIIIDDVSKNIDLELTRKKLENIVSDFAKEIPDEYGEKENMLTAIRYSYRRFYNNYIALVNNKFEKAKAELKSKINVDVKNQSELIGALFANLKRLDIKAIYDVTQDSDLTFTKGTPYIADYYKQLRDAINELADSPIHEPVLKKGSLTLRSMMEMSIRQDFHLSQMQDMVNSGTNIVRISTHADCSQRCSPFQGKLYSLNKTSGTIDGESYEPIENATDIFVTTKNGRVWKNGLFGFNCRHRMISYSKNMMTGIDYNSKEMQEEREITSKQRGFERMIYKNRLKSVLYSGIENNKASFYRQEAAHLFDLYKAYSEKNNRAFYPDRCAISQKMRQLYRGKII